jgi:hypothetical protein
VVKTIYTYGFHELFLNLIPNEDEKLLKPLSLRTAILKLKNKSSKEEKAILPFLIA